MKVKHIFFDLDHTLWDFDKNSELAFKQIFKERNILIEIEVFLQTYIPINSRYWQDYQVEKVTKQQLKYGRLRDTFDALKYTVSDELINQIATDYGNYLPQYNHLIKDALSVLEYLKSKAYSLHIITNGFKEEQNVKLKKSKIKHFFDCIITSESVGVKKPNAKVFEFSLHKAKATPQNSVMIGDNYEADVLGALDVGMDAIYCNFEKKESKKGVKSISSLAEIKQFF